MQVKTKNLVVGGLIVLLVGMLWYRVVYSPMQSKASKANAAAHDANAQSAELQQTLHGSSPSNKKKTQSASSKQMLTAIPVDPSEAAFFRSLDAIRVSSGADWQTVAPSVPSPAAALDSINVAITASGTEDEIARYVEGLATLPRAFVMDSISIGQGGSSAAAGSGPPVGHAGAVFVGDTEQIQISGRIFSSTSGAAATTTGTGGTATTPTTGAPAPTGSGAPTGTVNG